MLSEKQIEFNAFSLKPSIVEDENISNLQKEMKDEQPISNQTPNKINDVTNGLNDLLQNVNTLFQESTLKNVFQQVELIMSKKKPTSPVAPEFKIINLDEEDIIMIEIDRIKKDEISITISNNIITLEITPPITLLNDGESYFKHSITLPYKVDCKDVTAFYSPALVDIHILKKRTFVIPLIERN